MFQVGLNQSEIRQNCLFFNHSIRNSMVRFRLDLAKGQKDKNFNINNYKFEG